MSADGKRIAIRGIVDVAGYDAGNVRLYDYYYDHKGFEPKWEQAGPDIEGEASKDYSGYYIPSPCRKKASMPTG
jgi:hypothetical protein